MQGHGSNGYGRVPGEPKGLSELARTYALLPLRVFLGVTFIYAGLDKLTDSAFLSSSGAGSIGDQMRGVRDSAGAPGSSTWRCTARSASGTPSRSASSPSASAPCSGSGAGSPRSAAR